MQEVVSATMLSMSRLFFIIFLHCIDHLFYILF
jgi:hypothetical protein